MMEGMVTSIEPGIYRPGKWGVRIENLVANVATPTGDFGRFLRFETLTLCPIDVRCLVVEKLSDNDLAWLNDYHNEVYERLSPLVKGHTQQWLREATRPVGRA